MSKAGMRYVGNGWAVDEATGAIHFFLKDALRDLQLPDTPASRAIVMNTARQAAEIRWPGVPIEEEE